MKPHEALGLSFYLTLTLTHCIETVSFTGVKQDSELRYHPPITDKKLPGHPLLTLNHRQTQFATSW